MAAKSTRRPLGPCEAARMRASLDLDSELDEIGALQLRRHLEGCGDCARWVAEMWELTGLLRTTEAEPAPCSSPPLGQVALSLVCDWSREGHRGDRSQRVVPRALR